jgi:hypothetical protein
VPDADDPLLSVVQVARIYGTGIRAVVSLVERRKLPSLDEGRLVARGRLDVPLIRRSWATALQRDSPGASRRVDTVGEMHPAVDAALDFHDALHALDAERTWLLSSRATRGEAGPEDVLEAWRRELGSVLEEPSGIGTAVYSLAPLPAVAARVFADPPAVPRAVSRPTPAFMLTALPLVEEEDGWKVDLALYRDRESWVQSLEEPLPSEGA